VFGRRRTEAVKDRAGASAALAAELARDRRFRKALVAALGHGAAAGHQARRRIGPVATISELSSDRELRAELGEMTKNLQQAKTRLDKKRSHKLRNTLLMAAATTLVAAPEIRRWITAQVAKLTGTLTGAHAKTTHVEVEANKPISRMTKDELVERAREEHIEVDDSMSRDEIYEALKREQGARPTA
jgi:hypothetical protein